MHQNRLKSVLATGVLAATVGLSVIASGTASAAEATPGHVVKLAHAQKAQQLTKQKKRNHGAIIPAVPAEPMIYPSLRGCLTQVNKLAQKGYQFTCKKKGNHYVMRPMG